jgi:hypothetical protein
MKRNVGGYDRIARLVVGPVLFVVGAATLAGVVTPAAGTLGLALGALAVVVGAVLAATAITRTCPLNSVLGVDTYGTASGPGSAADDADTRTGPN